MDVASVFDKVNIVELMALAIVLFFFVFRVTSPKSKNRSKEPFFILLIDVGAIIATGVLVLCLFVGVIKGTEDTDSDTALFTAANTPVHLFLELTPDLTVEETKVIGEEYEWQISETTHLWNTGEQELTLTVYVDRYAQNSSEKYGIDLILTYTYTTNEEPTLQQVYMQIRTSYGTATCYYYPTDYTEANYETGFNLTVKARGKLFSSKYLLDTAQEVIDIVYPIVYPDGLA